MVFCRNLFNQFDGIQRFTMISTKYQEYIIFDNEKLTCNKTDIMCCSLKILSPDI